ncbi:MAG: UDP-2-acetamido-2-deoxy-3-oxo-D-glucuronate aminotransferase [Syntrophaceae bacterium PtaU1.Bin231]|nr:MAG: UDP-2-acetamido-2-deoxy-3-oxo-D-glucuronate aminotransferase [Syntrophaceae bacterium PtaU1.Bin231]
MIPMVDLKRQYLAMKEEIDGAVQEVLSSTQFILGPNVTKLEQEIATHHGVPHAVGVANGTDALLLALQACGIREGDEVITTPFTFIATAEVVSQLRAVPVFADVLPDTFNIDPASIAAKITRRTKAVIPVHLFGHPAEMDPILALGREHGLRIIEDCAQAFGAEYHGRKVGTMGDCGCFSFFPSKNLAGCGDGGMIVTGNPRCAERIRMLRNHGSAFRYRHALLGYNSRLDEIQAAVIRVKFRRIDDLNNGRRRNAERYRAAIRRTDIILPAEERGCRHVYHQFTLRCRNRVRVMEALGDSGIASAVYYPIPLHQQEVFVNLLGESEKLPVSEALAAEVLSLPMFPELTEEEIGRISDVINHAV